MVYFVQQASCIFIIVLHNSPAGFGDDYKLSFTFAEQSQLVHYH